MYAFALNICKLSYSNKKYFIVEENYYINLNYKDSIIINVVTITKKKNYHCVLLRFCFIFFMMAIEIENFYIYCKNMERSQASSNHS